MELENEQTAAAAHTAGAEKVNGEEGGQVSYGKFKSAEALLSAYNSLQAEFTKRCQRLKELETAAGAADTRENLSCPAPREEMPEPNEKGITGEEKNEILKDYLKGILGQKTGAIIMDGAGVGLKTPAARPKTVEEAGRLFRGILD